MGTNTTGPKTRAGARSSLRQALPTDPIYTRGFSVGGHYSKPLSKNTQVKTSQESKSSTDKGN